MTDLGLLMFHAIYHFWCCCFCCTAVPVTVVGDRSNATWGCVVFSLPHANKRTAHKNQNVGGQNLAVLSCMQATFVLFYGVWTCNTCLSKWPMQWTQCQVPRSHSLVWLEIESTPWDQNPKQAQLWSLTAKQGNKSNTERGNILDTDPLGHPRGFPGLDRNGSPR